MCIRDSHSSLEKALKFKQNGGIIINLGDLPEATEKKGLNDTRVNTLLDKLFKTSGNNVFIATDNKEILHILDSHLTRDFRITSREDKQDEPYIMHRKIAGKELYAVYNVPKDTECFFRATGGIELWDPWTGTFREISASSITDEGTCIRMPLNKQDMHIFVFDPDRKATISAPVEHKVKETIVLDGEWAFELKPTLDNRFGDFHWPATPEILGAYIYKARYLQSSKATDGWQSPSFDDDGWTSKTFTFAPRFMLLEATPELTEELIFSNLP